MKLNRTGYVYVNQRLAGLLQEWQANVRQSYVFSYHQDYLDFNGPPIGVNFPLTPVPYNFDVFPPFFANLVSEGWVRRYQAQKAGLDRDDAFGLLLANGAELIGAVSVLNDELVAQLPLSGRSFLPVSLSGVGLPADLSRFRIAFRRDEFNDVAMASFGRASISGVQPKMFLTPDLQKPLTLQSCSGAGPYIVKPSPRDLPELAENEYMMMQLCKAAGFTVAEHYLLPFACGELAYVTRRFDLPNVPGGQLPLVEDLASCLNVAPGRKDDERLSYAMALRQAYQLCGQKATILQQGFRQVLMAYLIGNNDLHLKNFALQRDAVGTGVIMQGFSNIYDMVSVAPYRAYDGFALSLWLTDLEQQDVFSSSYRQYGYYTQHDFLLFGEALGLNAKAVQVTIDKLLAAVEKHYQSVIGRCIGSAYLKQALIDRIGERLAAVRRPILH
ncbi:type II toxin-antitoxin system HipA family toxin [Rheinheimera sp. F8]|uniref:type II toxin-antitoxin system HipA family toxin n=1 Tax=Rheinheimera sp. F8 TaxID=1763998 RepID=UPI000A6AFE5D|nr:type II toxin-antitoxin system HipA family toxin [Rheinheimera sp. F8]